MEKTFMIVLGDLHNSHYQEMLDNMRKLGESKEILDNVYVLITKENIHFEEVRNEIAGEKYGFCIVISFKDIHAAWSLSVDNSKYLQSFFSKKNGN